MMKKNNVNKLFQFSLLFYLLNAVFLAHANMLQTPLTNQQRQASDQPKEWNVTSNKLSSRLILADNELNLVVDDTPAKNPVSIESSFQQVTKLIGSNTEDGDKFGLSVAISGNTIVIGAPSEDSNATSVNGDQTNNLSPQSGAAYVFIHDGDRWIQQAYLKGSKAKPFEFFGHSVAISGDTIVVRAPGDSSFVRADDSDDRLVTDGTFGSTYVFRKKGSQWIQEASLEILDGNVFNYQGEDPVSIAISGDTIVLVSQKAYVFTRTGSDWSQQATLEYPQPSVWYRSSVSISGNSILIGVPDANTNKSIHTGATGKGAAFVYERHGSTWTLQAKLTAFEASFLSLFGASLAISGDTAVISSFGGKGNPWSTRLHIYQRKAAEWRLEDSFLHDSFALADNVIITGAETSRSGRRFDQALEHKLAYQRINSSWYAQSICEVSSCMGEIRSLSGNTLVTGDTITGIHIFNIPDQTVPTHLNQTISGMVWLDSNQDGLRALNEPGVITDIPLALFRAEDDQLIAETTPYHLNGQLSHANGLYQFEFVPAGDYYLCANLNKPRYPFTYTVPFNYSVTALDAGDNSIDNDFDASGCVFGIHVGNNQTFLFDLGLISQPIDLTGMFSGEVNSGFVWLDKNRDGLQDIGEPAVASVVLEAYSFGSGTLRARTVSDENGFYQFKMLQGDVQVCVGRGLYTRGLSATTLNAGENDRIDNDFDSKPCSIDRGFYSTPKRDLGLVETPIDSVVLDKQSSNNPIESNQVSGFVWLDNNGNGLQDDEEPGFAYGRDGIGITSIALYPNGSTDFIDRVALDEQGDGHFNFTGVTAGAYYVCASTEFDELGLSVTAQDAGNDAIDSDFDTDPCAYNINVSDTQSAIVDLGLIGGPIDSNQPIDPVPDSGFDIAVQLETVQLNHQWQSASHLLAGGNAVTFFSAATNAGAQRGVARMRSTEDGVEFRFQEWSNLDGAHTYETIRAASFPIGQWAVDNTRIEVGRAEVSGTRQWHTIHFKTAFATSPAVIVSLQTANGVDAVDVHVRNITASSMQIALYEEEAKMGSGHVPETAAYLLVSSDQAITLNNADSVQLSLPFQTTGINVNHDWVSLGNNHQIRLEEDQTKDDEIAHTYEKVQVIKLNDFYFVQIATAAGADPAVLRVRQ